jgi:hypothetical protein
LEQFLLLVFVVDASGWDPGLVVVVVVAVSSHGLSMLLFSLLVHPKWRVGGMHG